MSLEPPEQAGVDGHAHLDHLGEPGAHLPRGQRARAPPHRSPPARDDGRHPPGSCPAGDRRRSCRRRWRPPGRAARWGRRPTAPRAARSRPRSPRDRGPRPAEPDHAVTPAQAEETCERIPQPGQHVHRLGALAVRDHDDLRAQSRAAQRDAGSRAVETTHARIGDDRHAPPGWCRGSARRERRGCHGE